MGLLCNLSVDTKFKVKDFFLYKSWFLRTARRRTYKPVDRYPGGGGNSWNHGSPNRQMRFLLPSNKCSAAPLSFRLCYLNCAQRFDLNTARSAVVESCGSRRTFDCNWRKIGSRGLHVATSVGRK